MPEAKFDYHNQAKEGRGKKILGSAIKGVCFILVAIIWILMWIFTTREFNYVGKTRNKQQ